MSEFEPVDLGDRVIDPISGFKGIAHAITTWLNGCVRIAIAPEGLDKDGKVQEDRYFDIGQIRILDKAAHRPVTMTPSVEARKPITNPGRGGPARETSNFQPPQGAKR